MARYINSADALNTLKQLAYETALNQFDFDTSVVFEDIAKNRLETWVDLIPTADVVEVKHGKWIENTEYFPTTYTCPFCGYRIYRETTYFCPSCGADLREE